MKTAKKLISLALSAGLIGSVFTGTLVQRVSAAAEYAVDFEKASHKGYFEALGAESDEAWGIVDVPLSSIRNGAGNTENTKALRLTLNGDGTYSKTDTNLQDSDKTTQIPYAVYRLNSYYTEDLTSVSGKIGLPQGTAVGIIVDSLGNYGKADVIRLKNDANKTVSGERQRDSALFWQPQSSNGNTSWSSTTSYSTEPTGDDPVWISFKTVYAGGYAMLYFSATVDLADKDESYFADTENSANFKAVDLKYDIPEFALVAYADNGSNVLSTRISQSVAYIDDIRITTDGTQKTPDSHTEVDETALPELITFEHTNYLKYFIDLRTNETLAKSRLQKLSNNRNGATWCKTVLGNDSAFALKVWDKNVLVGVAPAYTAGKGYNTMTGKIGLLPGNDIGVVYEYTDDKNFKGFKINNNSNLLYINLFEKVNDVEKSYSQQKFKTAELVNSTYTTDALVQFFDFKLSYMNGTITFTVTSEAFDSDGEKKIVPELTASGTDLDFVFYGSIKAAYPNNGGKCVDDLKIYTETETGCTHNFVETSRTDADYLTAGEIVKTCSKCQETETETIYAYADFNKDGEVNETDLESFNAESADTELFSFDGVDGIGEFDTAIVKLLTKGVDFRAMIDANGDDKSDIKDLVRVKKLLANVEGAEGISDLNRDGASDADDLAFARAFLLSFSRSDLLN